MAKGCFLVLTTINKWSCDSFKSGTFDPLYCKSSDFPNTKHTACLLLLSGRIDADCKPLASRLNVTQQLHQQMHKNVSARDVRDLPRNKLGRTSDCSTVRVWGGFVSLPAAVSNKVSLIADINKHIQRRQNIHCPLAECVSAKSKRAKRLLLRWLAVRSKQVSIYMLELHCEL